MTVEELLKQVVNKDYKELVAIAKKAISNLIPPLTKMVSEDYAYKAILVFVASCVAADGTVTALEKKFLTEVLGIDACDTSAYVKSAMDYDFSNNFYDSLDRTLRTHLTMLCAACFAVDERINSDEIKLFAYFLK